MDCTLTPTTTSALRRGDECDAPLAADDSPPRASPRLCETRSRYTNSHRRRRRAFRERDSCAVALTVLGGSDVTTSGSHTRSIHHAQERLAREMNT